MASITTNPSPYLINIPELQNVLTSATGAGSFTTLSNSVTDVLSLVNPTTGALSINTLNTISGTTITFRNDINLSNAAILWNGVNLLTSNTLSGTGRLSFQVDRQEKAYLTADGNLYVAGDVYANSVHYPSDARLKQSVRPYSAPPVLPTPVEFTWTSNTPRSGARDIGFLADDVLALEPACVQRDARGFLGIDYAKLVAVYAAEILRQREELSTLTARVSQLEAAAGAAARM
jgi:hypothetical protein